jgi:large repetitive protein
VRRSFQILEAAEAQVTVKGGAAQLRNPPTLFSASERHPIKTSMRIHLPILLLACACALNAAIIQGTVVEAQTGRPLARTLVTANPVAGTTGSAKSVRTSVYGAFELEGLPAGAYLVTASRRAFATTQYGQKQWKSAGLPVVLEEPQKIQIQIRLPRLGAITGKIVDENEVGLPEHDVVVYRNAQPPVYVNRISSDDRGIYRFGGLEPGAYLIRAAAKTDEDGGYLPTFYKDVTAAEQARQIDVLLDQQAEEINVRPMPGRLFRVAGVASTSTMLMPITVTLVSDMGSESVTADSRGHFQFNPQAPGKYELNATSGPYAGYLPFELDRDQTELHIGAVRMPGVLVTFEDNRGGRVDPSAVQILARRKQLSGPGPTETLHLDDGRASLAPGGWEFGLAPNPAYYPVAFTMSNRVVGVRAEGWNEVVLSTVAFNGGYLPIKLTLSASPGAVHGAVNFSSQTVAGVPVFLEPYDLEPAKRLAPVRMTRTDARGQYQFTGLAPGQYRLLGTFEYQSPDSAEMETAKATLVRIEETKDLQQDLELYVAH